MKMKILLAVAAIMIFGLAIAAFAYTNSPDSSFVAASCCCCSGDSCPMKHKDSAGKETASSWEGCDCCGDADSCPMMKKDASGKVMKMADGAECPMMKKALRQRASLRPTERYLAR